MNTDSWPEPTPEIQAILDVLDDASQTGPTQWTARCPVPDHNDSRPSFQISEGDAQPVVVQCMGECDFAEDVSPALRGLDIPAEYFGGGTQKLLHRGRKKPVMKKLPRAKPVEQVPLEDQDQPHEWHAMLMAGKFPKFLEFLTNERGLTTETLERFSIGTDGERITIPVRPSYGERITIPVRPSYGEWINVRRYKPHAKQNKVLNLTGHGRITFYLLEVLKEDRSPVLLCEGEFDAPLANQESNGLYVAISGTGGAGNAPRDLSPLQNREVFVAYDNDDAGAKGAQKIVDKLNLAGAKARVLDIRELGVTGDKEDITDCFMQYAGTAEAIVKEMDRLRSGQRLRFEAVSAADLAEPVPPMKWLVKGVWPEGSYGTLAGEKKTLKTYTGLSLALAVASGEPFLGQFPVPEPRPVLMYLGEGGDGPTRRRLQTIAEFMELDLATLPLRMVYDAGDITGEEFLSSFKRHIEEEMPGLVIVDPFYAFHPAGIEAQNLYDRGAMLAEVQRMIPPGCAFVLADHFRKTGGKDLDLDSIAQSGVAQWADSWILQNHDTPPRVDEGQFSVGMQFGSRQWGGRQFVVDWNIGHMDEDSGEHVGDLSVSVRATEWGAKASTSTYKSDVTASTILNLIEPEPLVYTKTEVREAVKAQAQVGVATFNAAWEALVKDNRIVSEKAPGNEGKNRDRWRRSDVVREALSVSGGSAK
ncbi:hypothetical protein IWX78_001163 [Mycetocola sp. CAN_C7]|uniref:AAA family ATPase n=1 Tax=Mycetocola sp. CAN_C7 TaxID=2787724 RepID=UPI0018CB0D9F